MNEELKVKISANVDDIKKNVEDAKKQVKSFEERVEDAKDTVDESFQSIGNSIKSGLKAAAIGIAAAGAALLALGASTQEYRNEQAKLATAFETAGASAETAKETYNDLYRVLGDSGQATEAASHLAKLTTNEKELAEWTNICQGVYATFGDSIPIEGLTEAANETAKVGTVTGGLADALNWAGISEDAFNEKLAACNSEAERERLIRETLNGVYSDAAAKYEQNNAQVLKQNEAQAKLQETTAKLGEVVAPVITAFTEFANKALSAIVPHVQELAEKYLPVLEEVLGAVGEAVGNTMGFIADNWEIFTAIAGVIAGICAAIGIYNTVTAIKAAMDAAQVTTIWGLVSAHIAQAAAAMLAIAPYLLIVAAIAAVIAIIVLCIKYWDEIVAAVKKAAVAIWEALKAAWEWIANLFSGLASWFYDTVIAPIGEFFVGLWDGITGAAAAAWNGIKNAFAAAANWFNSTIIQPIGNFFSNMWNKLKNGAKAAWEGIKSVFSSVANFFGNIFRNAWEKVKAVFSVGGKIFDGIKDGIVSAFKTVVNAIIKGINKVVGLPFNGLNKILNTLQSISIAGIEPFGWLTWRAPVPQIPYLAKGGIIDSATLAVVGERGREAVLPLESNTEWMDMLVERISGRQSLAPIVLQVDGKTFAQISCDSINALTKQRGAIPLKIM